MEIMRVSDSDFSIAVNIYRESWQESHRDICTPEFLENRDYSGYLKGIQIDLFGIYDPDLVGLFLWLGTISVIYISIQTIGGGAMEQPASNMQWNKAIKRV